MLVASAMLSTIANKKKFVHCQNVAIENIEIEQLTCCICHVEVTVNS